MNERYCGVCSEQTERNGIEECERCGLNDDDTIRSVVRVTDVELVYEVTVEDDVVTDEDGFMTINSVFVGVVVTASGRLRLVSCDEGGHFSFLEDDRHFKAIRSE